MRTKHKESDFREYFARLVQAAGECDMSFAQIAREMGCTRHCLYGEHKCFMNSWYLKRFCEVTGASADFILGIEKKGEEE